MQPLQPEQPLLLTDAFQRAVMRNFVRHTDEKILPILLILNLSISLQPAASQRSDAQLKEKLDRIPTAERREAWIPIARESYTAEEKTVALAKLLALVEAMETMLKASPWLVAGAYSLADIAAVPFIARIAELQLDALDAASRPMVADWWERIQQRPAFTQACFERFDVALQARVEQSTAAVVAPS